MCADDILLDLFHENGVAESSSISASPSKLSSLTYEEAVLELINYERQYVRDLEMIIKVRERLKLFSNIFLTHCFTQINTL